MVRTRMFDNPPARRRAGAHPIRWLGILLIIFLTLSARAALQFDVFLGYEGVVPEASWFPVVCEVKNDGPSFTGTIEIVPSGNINQDQNRSVTVELPTGTLKRLVIPVFSTTRYVNQAVWDVRLLDQRGKVQAQQTSVRSKKQVAAGTTIMGALPRTASGMPIIRQGSSASTLEIQPASARLQTSILPDNPLTLEGMDCFYLNSEKAIELTVNQVDALLAWLNLGGHLIVGVEQIADVNGTPWLKKIMPCDVSDMKTVPSHAELQDWIRAGLGGVQRKNRNNTSNPFSDLAGDRTFEAAPLQVVSGKVRNTSEVVLSAESTPLIVTSHQGRGRVTALLASPEREPMRSWKNLPAFWAKMAEVPANVYATENNNNYNYSHGGWSVDGVFGAMIDSKQVRKLPVGWLLVLLLVYLLVIGPLDQIWLKRLKRPMLTWITFPCYVVLFSLLIYFIGYKLRAGETEWNELHLVDVLMNGKQAELRGRTYASIYSPVNAKYKIENQQHFSTFRGEYVGSWGGGSHDSEQADIVQNGDNFLAEIFVPVWTSQLYVSDWWQSAALPINFTITSEGNDWVVTVENHLDQPLTEVHLVVSGKILDLKEIPAEKPKTFRLSKNDGMGLKDFVWQHGSGFQSAVGGRHQAFGMGGQSQINDLPNSCVAISFLSYLAQTQGQRELVTPPGMDLSPVAEHDNAILLAWESDSAPIKPMNQFPTRRSHKNTLWRMTAPLNSQPSSL
ncbi:hypothetical protein [Pedosphaera parvula]|nr:hypothetical protein [Pedosphaera parvula]